MLTDPLPVPTAPVRKAPGRFFPGWAMVAVAGGAFFVSAPGQSYSVAAFKEPMRQSLGLTDTEFSLAYTVATLLSGALLPAVGLLLDAFGASRVLPLLTVLLGAACLGMAAVGGFVAFCVCLCCVRSLGQGAMTLTGNWLIGEWFHRRRGLATAIAGLGGGLSVLCVPLMNDAVIASFGWRYGWVTLAAGVCGLMVAPSLFFVRDRPEELGLAPDGEPLPPSLDPAAASQSAPTNPPIGFVQILVQPRFWLLLAPVATTALVVTGLVFHSVSVWGENGVDRRHALALVSAQALVALAATPLFGWVTDRLHARGVLSLSMACLAGAPLIALVAPSALTLTLYVTLLGAAEAANRTAGVTVWLEYYGRTRQGVVRGSAMAGAVVSAAGGPLLLALSRDLLGGYDAALVAFSAIAVLAGLAVLAAAAAPDHL